nr:PREDICTED: sodium-dependent proline transporter-like [Apteryx mantelli mantelli]
MMLGFKPGPYFRACWMILSPATMMALLVYNIVKYQPSEYGSYRFPAWAEVLGILMGLFSCLMIPAGMVVAVLREEGTLWEVGGPVAHCCWGALQKCWDEGKHEPLPGLHPPAIPVSPLLEMCIPVPPSCPQAVSGSMSQDISSSVPGHF